MKYSDQHSKYGIRAAHDGKVRFKSIQYTTAFLYSSLFWLAVFSMAYGINHVMYKTNFK